MNKQEVIRCDGCGVEVSCNPYPYHGDIYCCLDCAQGLRCECVSRLEDDACQSQNKPIISLG